MTQADYYIQNFHLNAHGKPYFPTDPSFSLDDDLYLKLLLDTFEFLE
jgi:hypothetical protein